MTGQYTFSRNPKPIQETAMVGFLVATLSWKLEGAATLVCHLLDKTAWAATEVLRSAILAGWPSVLAYLCEDSRFMQHLLQILASLWPLVGVLAG
jgi:hypothetical protein